MAYVIPTAADLIALYPTFAAVPSATLSAHLNRASTQAVGLSWLASDYDAAILEYAAHTLAGAGLEAQNEVGAYVRAGVTSIRTGQFSASFSDKAVSDASGGGLKSTRYGRAYLVMLKRNKGGARIVSPAVEPDGWGPTARTNDLQYLP